ncbi:efflux transporter outer membrane subunit [Sphingomonas swuensis]|uniref:Efflux transporter outer membrane subunit n=1 Tax=Sphingomonas swuensis TaxID=977800 RepID=A0ABP7SN06_9SPHN
MRRPLRCGAGVLALLAAAGCAPSLRPLPAASTVNPPLEWRTQLPGTAAIEPRWWDAFGDPALSALVEAARASNNDVLLAAARIEEARGTEAASRSLLFPTVEAGVNAAARREVSPFGKGQESVVAQPLARVSYELDLFGRNRAGIDAARAGTAASEAAREATLLSVSAATASGYVTLLALDERLATLRRTLAVLEQSVRFARRRAEVGYTSQLEWRQAQAEYQGAAQSIPQVEAQIARQENALSVLTGHLPRAIRRGGTLASLIRPATPAIVPAELLRRRPDIAAAEYQLAASDAQMRAARARFMPTFGISATAGAVASDLLSNPISVWSLGGSVLAPIFDGGRLRGQLTSATARRDQAAFAYRGTVLTAFREVEDRLATLARLDEQKRSLDAQRLAVADALRHARNRYDAGYSPYIEQIDAQRQLLGVDLSMVQLRADQLNAVIGLYQAVGTAPPTAR